MRVLVRANANLTTRYKVRQDAQLSQRDGAAGCVSFG